MIRDSMRLDRVKRVFGRIVEEKFAGESVAVRWADLGYPRAPLPFVVLKIAVVPSRTSHGEWPRHELRTSTLITVAPVSANERRTVWVNCFPFYAEGSSATEIRDGLVTAVEAGFEPVDAVAVGSDQLRVSQSEPGGLHALALSTGLSEVIESTAVFRCWSQRRRGLLSINAHASTAVGSASADIIAAAVMDVLEDPDIARELATHGIGLGAVSSPRDLSAVEGSDTETRVQFDVAILLRARSFKEILDAEVVAVTGDVNDQSFNLTIEQ